MTIAPVRVGCLGGTLQSCLTAAVIIATNKKTEVTMVKMDRTTVPMVWRLSARVDGVARRDLNVDISTYPYMTGVD